MVPALSVAKYSSAADLTLGARSKADTVVGIAIKAKHPSISPTAASSETIEDKMINRMKK